MNTDTPTTDARWEKLCCSGQSWYQIAEEMKLDCRQLERELNAAREELAEWSILKGWGGTPEIINDFIKGQQTRIHYAQNLEEELTAVTEQRDKAWQKIENQAERITYLEGATNHATGTPLSKTIEQRDRLAEAVNAATILIAAKGRHNTMLAYNGLRDALQSLTPNVKEHAPLSAGARVDHGVKVKTTDDSENRAADRGCCVSTCSPSSFSVYDTRHPIHQPYQKPIFGSKNTTGEHENRAADGGCCVSPCSISSFLLEGLRHKDPAVRVMKWLAVFNAIMVVAFLIYKLTA